jgi:hypothetical protein
VGGTEIGVGPLLTLPTANNRHLGTGKWQGGVSAVGIHPEKWGMLGGLVQWQASFAGDENRADLNTLTAQPFFIYNLPHGWYARSTGIWSFDLKNNTHYIPLGLGIGKIWKTADGTTMNLFAEPQWTVSHDRNGYPKFQVFMGLNMTFGK